MRAIDLLVRADYLYPMSEGLPIIADGEVAIAGDRIVHAGPRQPEGSWQARRVIGGTGRAVLPGFVNAHTHTASVIFRSQTDDFSGGVGLYTVAFRMEKDVTEPEWRLLAQLGCVDMLRAGVTTINDIWYCPEGLAEAVEQSGLRAQIANKVFDVRLEALHQGDYTHYPEIGASRLRHGVEFVERWHGRADGRITGRIATHATDTCDTGLHREARAEARRLGVGMHIHTAQSAREVERIRTEFGCGPLEYIRDIGLLADDVVVAHLSFASDGDLQAVRETGARYAHCPTIYPRRGRYPRLQTILERGIPTGFGTDWMLNDPFEGMRIAMNTARVQLENPDFLPSEQALWHFTMGSARVLGMADRIGSLEAGKKADLIAVDIAQPHLQPFHGGYPALVWYAKASDVVTSVIDGQVVLDDRKPVRLDEAWILREIGAQASRWRSRLRALGSRTVFGADCACC